MSGVEEPGPEAGVAAPPIFVSTQKSGGLPLRAHLRDLAALLALPRVWKDKTPEWIAGSLLDVLVTLLRVDLAGIEVRDAAAESFRRVRPADASDTFETLLARSQSAHLAEVAGAGGVPLRVMRVSPHVTDQEVVVIAASARPDFPTEIEAFLCRVAVDQAMLAAHSSRLVASLAAANAAKSTFLATMSHELRTPLNAIIGYSGLLRAEIDGSLSASHRHHVQRIDGAARHLLELIEGILNFARLEAGKERAHLARTRVSDIANSVIALVEPLASAKGLNLATAAATASIETTTDEAKVRQILLNLLSNAVKFTATGHVGLDVRAEDDEVVWTVSDTGIGIAPEDLPLIFEPFRQVGEVHTHRSPGTGLGLSVSRHLARLLGGDIAVESTPGRGSTFIVRLPLTSTAD